MVKVSVFFADTELPVSRRCHHWPTALSMIRWSKRHISRSRHSFKCRHHVSGNGTLTPAKCLRSRGRYSSPMKSSVSADSCSTTILRACCRAGALHCWNIWRKVQIMNEWLAKDIAAIACSGKKTIYLHNRSINNQLGTTKRWSTNGQH